EHVVMDKEKNYCIRTKHVVIICMTVVVCCLVVGLAVGLTREGQSSTTTPTQQPPISTTEPTKPPVPDRGPCLASTDSSGGWQNFRPDFVTPVHYNREKMQQIAFDHLAAIRKVELEQSRQTRDPMVKSHKYNIYLMEEKRQRDLQKKKTRRAWVVEKDEALEASSFENMSADKTKNIYSLVKERKVWLYENNIHYHSTFYVLRPTLGKIAATDHEPTDARKSFPCFDEPNKKATYNISITHDSSYKALSNMPKESSENLPRNKTKTSFQKSVPMSTYLVCFAVHEFTFVEKTSAKGIPLQIFLQTIQLHLVTFISYIRPFEDSHYADVALGEIWFHFLDKIAIPDFGTGAMENWGLITYRETNLLYDEQESSSYNKQRVASVIAHELVHQWFGNIVTMDWWDDLWLNEGFASFFEYVGVEEAEKDWEMRDIMIIDDVLPVMVDDALLSSHPIIVNVSTPAEITSVFDSISYSKGASVLRMLEDWMGKEKFRDGCRVSDIALRIQFFYLCLQKKVEFVTKHFLTNTLSIIKMGMFWVMMFNDIPYDGKYEFSAADRTSYMDDVFALARADILDYGNAFNLTMYLTNETDYIVWSRVSSSIAYVRDMLSGDTDIYPKFQKLFRSHVKSISKELGWEDTGTQTERLLRETVLSIACQMGDEETLKEASRLFEQWIRGSLSKVPVNLRLLVYRYGMKMNSTEDNWNIVYERYKNTSLAQERDKLLYGLASVENVTLLNRLLEATKNENVVRSQDLFTVVRYVSYNPLGQSMAWDWTTLNWDYLVKRYTINDRNLGRLLNQITTTYNTELQIWKMEHFFALTPDSGAGKMPRQQALETVRNNIEWIQRNKAEIKGWLQKNV
uniref:Aminopeptidase n=1 Tax=Tetraodon nigroviridis TaxID=99883 RepID=H3CIK3_TETNG